MKNPKLSVVIPVFNEAEVLAVLDRRLSATMRTLGLPYEIVFVNDGSTDESQTVLEALSRQHPSYKIITLSRNFGHQLAITAGLDHAAGDAVVVMDADLQDPPEVIPELIEKWREGFDVVYAVRRLRQGESTFKRATASVFYRMLKRITDLNLPVDAGDFRLMSRRAVEEFKKLRENHRFVRGMTTWIGFAQTGVLYDRSARAAGQTGYPLRKMFRLASDAILAFSTLPLQIASYLGLVGSVMGFLLLAYAVYVKLFTSTSIVGWTSVIAAITFIGSIQLLTIGVIGGYVARIYDEVRRRPLYIVSSMKGFEPRQTDLGASAVFSD